MKHTEIPLLDYIDIYDEQCDLYVHTKDKRVLVFKDVQSNGHLDETGFSVDYMFLTRRMTVFVSRDDFSHLEYCYSLRNNITKKDFDELHSFVEDQLWDDLV
jgi:tRNA splicing endonuclease